jgi:hypothetical protein
MRNDIDERPPFKKKITKSRSFLKYSEIIIPLTIHPFTLFFEWQPPNTCKKKINNYNFFGINNKTFFFLIIFSNLMLCFYNQVFVVDSLAWESCGDRNFKGVIRNSKFVCERWIQWISFKKRMLTNMTSGGNDFLKEISEVRFSMNNIH